ncbi:MULTISPECIES: MarR family transcriptional regulator [Ramlibacter]|uniref:MarR family transcriptional regulator n=1 Tax=Ramlibacter aquaticus TaxID=2780094 RepID=A0ABR9SJY4_9BURK|nr:MULTISPECIES: MarR family transcriptional regulator [Ramlibacter]MBE7942560.1 MarR family transcriptional regulator [Ramlibacter aquaticus]
MTLDPQHHFGFLLKDVSRLYTRSFGARAEPLGLSLDRCRVLGYLRRQQGLNQAQLAELCDTDPMTLGRLLARMEAEGLVEREPNPDDRRAHRLRPGRAAGRLLARMDPLADQTEAGALAGLDAAERRQLAALLERVKANLTGAGPC